MSDAGIGRQIEILLVEDNPADVRMAQENFREAKIRNHLYVVDDGVKAMSFLRREGTYADAVRPDLILLDLNIPRKNGREVLEEIKTDDTLKRIPVVILTASKADEDIIAAYNLHANCYITTPIDLNQFVRAVQSIEEFWLTIVALPNA
jgi:two-component system, chemotaxis family, response regulator Rcp1